MRKDLPAGWSAMTTVFKRAFLPREGKATTVGMRLAQGPETCTEKPAWRPSVECWMGAWRLEEPQGPLTTPCTSAVQARRGASQRGSGLKLPRKRARSSSGSPGEQRGRRTTNSSESDVTIETFKCHTLMTLATKAEKAAAKIPTYSTRTISTRFCSRSSQELSVEAVNCPRIPPALQFPGLDHMPHMELHFLHLWLKDYRSVLSFPHGGIGSRWANPYSVLFQERCIFSLYT